MSGKIIQVFERTDFDMSGLPDAGQFFHVDFRPLDLSEWTECSLVLRVHSGPTWGAGAWVAAGLGAAAPTPEDPQHFANLDLITAFAQVDQNMNAPTIAVGNSSGPFWGVFYPALAFQQASVAAPYRVTVSADLCVKRR